MIVLARRHIISSVLALSLGLLAGCRPAGVVTRKYYYTRTEDGVMLALRRYRSANLSQDNNPVILCHGLSYNMIFWDLRADVSLAQYLAQTGYDVWCVSLRGAFPSSQPLNSMLRKLQHFHLAPEMVTTIKERLGGLTLNDWSVDDHINYDVPAVIDFVKKTTHFNQVHWIGHSMGGMIMFAYLQKLFGPEGSGVKSFVAASVPMVVFHPLSNPLKFLLQSEKILAVGSRIVGSSAPATWGVIFGNLDTPLNRLFFNSENMDNSLLRDMFWRVEEEISPSQLKQLLDMVRTERFHSLDGKIDYTAYMSEIQTPTLFLVGTVDNLATVGAVRWAYREIGSENKQFALFGRVNSQKHDYGHDDIILGRHAREEVFPVIKSWLDRFPRRLDESKLPLQPEPLDLQHTHPNKD